MPRVLIADIPEAVTVLSEALTGDIAIIPALDIDEALLRVRLQIDLIITGIHFADSQMLDFVQAIKAQPDLRDLPVVCVRLYGVERAPVLLNRLQPALREFAQRIRVRLAAGRRPTQPN